MLFRLFVYLFPVIMNLCNGGAIFIAADRMSRSGASALAVSATTMTWALGYSIASFAIGRVARHFQPARLVSFGALLMTAACIGFIVCPSLPLIYLWTALIAVSAGIYCAPFQAYMDIVAPATQSVGQTTALYTVAWSSGVAAGPFIFGTIHDWRIGFVLCAALSVYTAVGVLFLDRHCRRHGLLGRAAAATDDEYAGLPTFIRIAWPIGAVVTFAIAVVRPFEPYKAAAIGLTTTQAAYIMTTVSVMQAATAALLYFSRRWMYRPAALVAFGLAESAGLLLFWKGGTAAELYLAAILTGIGSGAWYNFFTFHAIVDRARATFNASINETIVGIASIAAPWIAGLVASRERPGACFLLAAVLFLATTIAATGAMLRRMAKVKP
jgi:MFS family permease